MKAIHRCDPACCSQCGCLASVVTASSRSQGRCLALVVTAGRVSRLQLQRAHVTPDLSSRKESGDCSCKGKYGMIPGRTISIHHSRSKGAYETTEPHRSSPRRCTASPGNISLRQPRDQRGEYHFRSGQPPLRCRSDVPDYLAENGS